MMTFIRNNVGRRLGLLFAATVLICALSLLITRRSDSHLAVNETRHRLQRWHEAVALAERAGAGLAQCRSIDEAADKLVELGIAFPSERRDYVEDFWNQQLIWLSNPQYGFITISSVG